MGAFFKGTLGLIVVVIIAGVLGLGYLGFIPGVSSLFGSDKPRDLGIKPTQADLTSFNAKTGVKLVKLPSAVTPEKSLEYSGQKPANSGFSDEELTAAIQNSKWMYNPISDTQIKINEDGTAEASGILRMDRVYGYAQATGISAGDVKAAVDVLRIGSSNPPFYVKGTVSVNNNKVNLNAQELEIGRFPVPSSLIADNKGRIVSLIEDRINSVPGLSVKSASFVNGQMKFEGTLPEVEATAQN